MNLWRPFETALTYGARLTWPALQAINRQFTSTTFQPNWAPAPLLKSADRTKPQLGWPRTTDSLCPTCVRETRARILSGEQALATLVNENVGEIKANILERDGKIIVEKTCATHGTFTDTLAINPDFLRRIENLFPGRDFDAVTETLHNHGMSSIKHGRGAVLTIDLTNRCNMMCDPCFMDANQVGYVHELTLEEVKQLLDDAVSVKPRRQMTVQFSGGEPTLSPIFLDAVRYAAQGRLLQHPGGDQRHPLRAGAGVRARGARAPACASRICSSTASAKRRTRTARSATYSTSSCEQSRTVTPPASTSASSSRSSTRSTTTRWDRSSSSRSRTATRSASYRSSRCRSPAGTRTSAMTMRHARRYTLSHLAEDLKQQTGVTEPLRDWFPLSASSALSDVTDLLKGPGADWGTLKCGCHPDCGIGTAFMVSKKTREWAPLGAFMNVERFLADARVIADSARSPVLTKLQTALSLLRNYTPGQAPRGFRLFDLIKKFDKQSGGQLGGRLGARDDGDRKQDEWLLLFVAGMWFQDLWTYDFRRTEMCIIPYATQMGEISFCAYNTGVGWRQIVEKMYQNATVADWYKENGKHAVYANPRKPVPLEQNAQPVSLRIPRGGKPSSGSRRAQPQPSPVTVLAREQAR